MENWQSIYDNPEIIPIQTKGILIFNGNDILNKNILNIKYMKFSMVLLIYLPNVLCGTMIIITNRH
jgi:hypothetical protein